MDLPTPWHRGGCACPPIRWYTADLDLPLAHVVAWHLRITGRQGGARNRMNISQRPAGKEACLISLDGTLNAASSDELKETFRQVAAQGTRQVVLDLSKVHFIDSSGLAALIFGAKSLGGDDKCLKLAGLQPQAQLLLKITMFDKVFEVYPDVESALKACHT